MHPSSLDLAKKRFGERCHVHLRGHKMTMEEIMSCYCCCGTSDTEEEDEEEDEEEEETSFIQVRKTLSSSDPSR